MVWVTIEEAPNYQINEQGHIRSVWSNKCVKHQHDDPEGDGPYVRLRIEGSYIRRSVRELLAAARRR